MDDAVAVSLVMRAPFGRGFRVLTSAGVAAELRVWREDLAFDLFQFLSRPGHIANAELNSICQNLLHRDAAQFKQAPDGVRTHPPHLSHLWHCKVLLECAHLNSASWQVYPTTVKIAGTLDRTPVKLKVMPGGE